MKTRFVMVWAMTGCLGSTLGCATEVPSASGSEHAPGCVEVETESGLRLFCTPEEGKSESALLASPTTQCGGVSTSGDSCVDDGFGCSAECWSCSESTGSLSGSCNNDGSLGGGGDGLCGPTWQNVYGSFAPTHDEALQNLEANAQCAYKVGCQFTRKTLSEVRCRSFPDGDWVCDATVKCEYR